MCELWLLYLYDFNCLIQTFLDVLVKWKGEVAYALMVLALSSFNKTSVMDLALSSLSETYLIQTYIFFLGWYFGGLGFVIVQHDLPCLSSHRNGVDLASLSLVDACLIYTSKRNGLSVDFVNTSLHLYSSLGKNRMNLVFQDVLFRLIIGLNEK